MNYGHCKNKGGPGLNKMGRINSSYSMRSKILEGYQRVESLSQG
jgi:hypothetical protein